MKIFISSTFEDLKEEREKLHKSLKKAGFESLGMEFFVAESNSQKEVCLREVQNANLVLLIVTDKYGTVDEKTQKSYTHLEFDKAKKAGIETLAFLYKDPADQNVKKFQDEIKASGITVDFFENNFDISSVLYPALFNYVITKGLIPNKTKTFNDFAHFYARSFRENSLFNYKQKFIGRTNELAKLYAFLSDTNQQIAIINAAGGIGKSKLIYEFSQDNINNSDWNFRFVPSQVGFDNDSIRELPAQNTCVIIEDAHKQKTLDSLVYSLINNFPYEIKIIITTRPSGLKSIKEALREYDPVEPINLAPLLRDDSIELAKSILKDKKQDYAEEIHRASRGNTLVIVMASELIQRDQLDGTLLKDPVFKEKVLEKILVELEEIDSKGINLSQLLATLAGLSPLIDEPSTFELLSKSVNIEKHDLKSILDDFQRHGFIVKIGNRLRVVPDILADYILLKHSVNSSNESTGFIDVLLKRYGKSHLRNLLVNISELEHYSSAKLAEGIWASINKKTKKCDNKDLCSALETIEPVAYYSPNEVYGIISKILEGEIEVEIDKGESSESYEIRRIANLIISILGKLGERPKFTKRACLELWKISTGHSCLKFLGNFTESPPSSFKKLTSFDNNNLFSVQKEAMEAAKKIINTNQHIGYENELCEIIESVLRPEIEIQGYSMRSFSLSWFCVYDVDETSRMKVAKARSDAFDLYSLLIDKSETNALFLIAKKLIQKLRRPYLRNNKLQDKAKVEFEREAKTASALLKKMITKNITILNNCIYELVSEKSEKLLDNIDINDVISEGMKSDYDIFYCMKHDWPQDYDDDFDARDKRFQDMQEYTAKRLWENCGNNPEILLGFLLHYRTKLEQHGIAHGDYAFLHACAKVKPELCSKTIDIIIDQNKDDYFASMISTWLKYSPEDQQYNSSKKVLENGNACHRASLARSLTALKGLKEDELVGLIEDLSKDSEQEVIDATIRGLGIVCHHMKIKDELPRVVDVICNYETQNDPNKLEILLDNFNPHWLSPDILSDAHVSQLLEKIKHVKKLESQHDTGVFLSHITTKKPLECVRLFLWRIQNMTADDTQSFPYNEGFHDKPKDLISHAEYPQCIIEILNAMKEYDQQTYFWCPTVVRWLDPVFSNTTKSILLDNLGLHDNALKAITYIFVRYERNFFLNNIDFVNWLLIQASQLPDKDTIDLIHGKLSFMPFSGARCMSGLGKPDGLCLDIISKCEKILQENSECLGPTSKFYLDLIEYAKHENQRKLDRDNAELKEEEFG